jgi:nucleotide-binding universal stress UspA family protein
VKVYKHILVPLDGSKLAELALDDAFSLAQYSQAKVTLLQVITPIEHILGDTGSLMYVDEYLTTQQVMASEYLKEISQKASQMLTVHLAVEVGLAADTIIDYANQHAVDLIIMATHGRSGLRRWVYGSVADKVLRGAKVPILIVRTHAEPEAVSVEEVAENI